MDTTNQTVSNTTQTLDASTGKPPKSRVVSSYAVYSLCKRLRDDDSKRAVDRDTVKRCLDGFKPYSLKYLQASGQAGDSNIPFRTAESNLNIIQSTYANLIFDVPVLVDIYVKDDKIADKDYGPEIAQKFHDLLMSWGGFVDEISVKQKNMLTFGPSMVYFPDRMTFKFRALHAGQFLVDSGAPSSIDRISELVIRSEFTATELFWKIMATDEELDRGITDEKKQQIAAEDGWNLDLVKEMIIRSNTNSSNGGSDQYGNSSWESVTQQIKNGDTYSSERIGKIRVDNLFIQEFRGGISWYMIPEDWPSADGKRDNIKMEDWDKKGFLYSKAKAYKSMLEVGSMFFIDVGDGTFHSVKGYGVKNYSHNVLIDRMMNRVVDANDMNASIMVQGDQADIRKVRFGRFTLIPRNVEVLTNVLRTDINSSISVTNFLRESLDKNSGIHAPDMTGGKDTAKGERIQLFKEGKVERKDIMRYYLYLDKLYSEMLRRILDPHQNEYDPDYACIQQFKKACIDAGVPAALLKFEALLITATRAIGFGSPAHRNEIMNDLVSGAGHFPEIGSMNAVRDWVSNLVGHKNVRRYAPEDASAKDPSNNQSFAVLENSIMQSSGQVLVGKDQMHVAHIQVHMEPLQQIAQQFVSTGGVGGNPMATHDFFAADLMHIGQHMDMIKDDPLRKKDYVVFMAQFDELRKIYQAIDAMVRKLQDQMQREREDQLAQVQNKGETDPEMQLKREKMQLDASLQAEKEANLNEQRIVKTSHAIGAKDAMLKQKMSLADAMAKQEMELKAFRESKSNG